MRLYCRKFPNVQLISNFSVSYHYNDGCTHGLNCTRGMFCGNLKDEACRNCSFEKCLKHAKRSESYAFSYTATSKQFCRLCDEEDVVKKTPYRGWGIYVRGKITSSYSLVHIRASFFSHKNTHQYIS